MDVGAYKQWMSMVSHSEILAEASTFRKLAYIRADLPKPLSNRQIIVQAAAHYYEGPTLDSKGVVLALSSFNPNESWLNKYDLAAHVTKKLVTLDVQNSFALVKPIREGTTRVQIMLTSDPKMDFVP